MSRWRISREVGGVSDDAGIRRAEYYCGYGGSETESSDVLLSCVREPLPGESDPL